MDRALQAVGDPTRRRILDLLSVREHTAGELAGQFPGISRPAVSQHIAVLKEAGLVKERQAGRHRYYRLEPEPLRQIWEGWLSHYERFWDHQLAALKLLVESDEWDEKPDGGDSE